MSNRARFRDLIIDIESMDRAVQLVREAAFYYGVDTEKIIGILSRGKAIPLITGAALCMARDPNRLQIRSMSWDGVDLEPYRDGFRPRYDVLIDGRKFSMRPIWSPHLAAVMMHKIIDSISVRGTDVCMVDSITLRQYTKWHCISAGEWHGPSVRRSERI